MRQWTSHLIEITQIEVKDQWKTLGRALERELLVPTKLCRAVSEEILTFMPAY